MAIGSARSSPPSPRILTAQLCSRLCLATLRGWERRNGEVSTTNQIGGLSASPCQASESDYWICGDHTHWLTCLSYGLMGRAVLHRHFQNLMKWGFLAALASTSAAPSPIHPLSTQEFISHVLIPEAAILLVMQDQGWSRGTSRPEDWDDRRAEAFQIWRGSTEYGRYRFREDGEEAEVVYSQLEEIYPETRRKLEESRLSKSIEDEEGSESSRGASGTSVGEQHDIGLAAPSSSFGDGDWGEEALMQISTLADRAELSYRSGSNAASEGKRGRVACG